MSFGDYVPADEMDDDFADFDEYDKYDEVDLEPF